jgi:hypothetical protein
LFFHILRNLTSLSPADAADSPTLVRRANVTLLFKEYAEKQMAQGVPPKGIEQAFAASLEISPSLWSQIKSSRPLGDKLARQIEAHAKRPVRWLDQQHDLVMQPSAAEERFIALARQTWRQANSRDKKQLIHHLKTALKPEASAGSLR